MGGAALDAIGCTFVHTPAWVSYGRGAGAALRWAPVSETGDEIALVIAARDGDRAAFGMLYQRYGRMVHGVLLTRVARGQVEDLVQDVFLSALKRLDSLREPARFGGWLAMIARNRATDFHRRSRDTVELTEDVAGTVVNDDDAEALAVLATLRTLPEAYRETLVLRLVEGMTGPEIAARTGMTEGSVRVNLHRGMKLLRAKLGVESDHV
jgi:RNA polymerase sigma-70 factor, ECF subfamily